MRGVAAAFILLALSGCVVEFDYKDTRFRCDRSGDCPDDFECKGNVCVEATPAADAGAPDASAP